jgi:mercuric ion transport protein
MKKPGILAISAAVVSALPVLGCPLCWPGYAALLSSLGLGFLASARFLFPLTMALLALALAGLGVQARRQGFVPLALGVIASGTIGLGKFVLGSDAITDAGVALLLAASVVSVFRGGARSPSCGGCADARLAAGPPDRPASGA